MGISIDATTNYRLWGNTEGVFYTSEATAGDSETRIEIAKRRAPTWRERQASGGVYTGQDLVWLIPVAEMDSAILPKPADRITDDDDNTWTVLEVAKNALKSTWRCVTRNLKIVYDLQDLLTVKRPTNSKDNALGRTASFSTVYSSIPCRIDDDVFEDGDSYGKKITKKRFRIWVDRQLTLTAEDLLQDGDGNSYSFVSITNQHQLGELPMIMAERRSATT